MLGLILNHLGFLRYKHASIYQRNLVMRKYCYPISVINIMISPCITRVMANGSLVNNVVANSSVSSLRQRVITPILGPEPSFTI